MAIKVGDIMDSKHYGKFKIVAEMKYALGCKNKQRQKFYLVEFLDTGYRVMSSYCNILKGCIIDRYVPSVAGVGYQGDYLYVGPHNELEYSFVEIWSNIISRCYNPNYSLYKYYGALGVTVDTSWHNFSNFRRDIQFLPGYDDKMREPKMYQLDKDYLQLGKPHNEKVYSKDTCIWISKYDNIVVMKRENNKYFGVVKKGKKFGTNINNEIYGLFTIPEAAANLFNYLYPILPHDPYNKIWFMNENVPKIPFSDLQNYGTIYFDKISQKLVGSTTIDESRVDYSVIEALGDLGIEIKI